jgi:HlyD family secretion protein
MSAAVNCRQGNIKDREENILPNLLQTTGAKFKTLAGLPGRKKLYLGIAALLIVILAGYLVFGRARNASGSYITDTVKRGRVASTISASGMVEPVSTVSLSFKNAEVIKKIYVKIGDRVSPGQLVAEQDSENLEAELVQVSAGVSSSVAKHQLLVKGAREEELAQSEASMQMAQASYDQVKATFERNQMLYQAGAISQADFENAQVAYINAEGKLKQAQESLKVLQAGSRPEDITAAAAQVESSKAQLKMAQSDLAGAKMVSPLNGIVSEVNGAEGQRATANNNNTSGSGGFIVIISEALQIRAQVNEADIGKAQTGQMVEFSVNSFPEKVFKGKVSSIAPQAYTLSNVQIYDVIIQLDQSYNELKAGMPANVTIIVESHENILTIPKGAVSYAVTYLNKNKQAGSAVNNTGSSAGSNAASQRQSTGQNSGQGAGAAGSQNRNPGTTGDSGSARQSAGSSGAGRQADVLVLDKSGNPVQKRVTLGLSDMRNYEVSNGLDEGETVVVGSLSQTASGTQSSQGGQGGGQGGGMSFVQRLAH